MNRTMLDVIEMLKVENSNCTKTGIDNHHLGQDMRSSGIFPEPHSFNDDRHPSLQYRSLSLIQIIINIMQHHPYHSIKVLPERQSVC